MTKVLAIDPGVKGTGWAYRIGNDLAQYGTEGFTRRRDESDGFILLRWGRWFRELAKEMGPGDLLIFEEPHHRGGGATAILERMVGLALEHAALRLFDFKGVHSSTLKKWVVGKGNADKPAVNNAMLERGYSPEDEHQADALMMLEWLQMGMPEAARKQRKRKEAKP